MDLDPRFTFETFVVGSGNRLACAAAMRVAESPGTAYNPLFLYSASGLGKTHLIMAIGDRARRVHPGLSVVYETLDRLLEGIVKAIEAGDQDGFRQRLLTADVLMLDDVQFLAGRRGPQEELLRAWDALSARGGQVVLASDRPPTEIDDLDQRLLSRFSGGLITDVAAPDYETRVAIVNRKTTERGQRLGSGVAEALARAPFANVRELQGALNRVLAVQELDGREVDAPEAAALLGLGKRPAANDEFGSFLNEIAGVVSAVVRTPSPGQRLADAIMKWEGEGYRTQRLEAALAAPHAVADIGAVVDSFAADVQRLVAIATELRTIDPTAPELSRLDILRNPDRVTDAEAFLAHARERLRPFPPPPPSPTFDGLAHDRAGFPIRAARAIAAKPGGEYNPFFVHGPEGSGKSSLIIALANELRATRPDLRLAFLDGGEFAADVIQALERTAIDAWRARMRRVHVLVIDDVDALTATERAQDELFHLFDDLHRTGAQLVFTAARPPGALAGLENRLRTRLESGLVVDVAGGGDEAAGTAALPVAADVPVIPSPMVASSGATLDVWFESGEKVVWEWPDPSAWLIEQAEGDDGDQG